MSAVNEANGNRIKPLVTQPTTEARRLAADLPRDCGEVNRVRPDVRYDAKVWLADGQSTFTAPDGWTIERVFISDRGSASVALSREQ